MVYVPTIASFVQCHLGAVPPGKWQGHEFEIECTSWVFRSKIQPWYCTGMYDMCEVRRMDAQGKQAWEDASSLLVDALRISSSCPLVENVVGQLATASKGGHDP